MRKTLAALIAIATLVAASALPTASDARDGQAALGLGKWLLYAPPGYVARPLSSGRADAQIPREWAQCIGREGPIPDFVIQGCSAIIEAAQEEPRKIATAFNNRGVAHRRPGGLH
jgi:hypothetical protein